MDNWYDNINCFIGRCSYKVALKNSHELITKSEIEEKRYQINIDLSYCLKRNKSIKNVRIFIDENFFNS